MRKAISRKAKSNWNFKKKFCIATNMTHHVKSRRYQLSQDRKTAVLCEPHHAQGCQCYRPPQTCHLETALAPPLDLLGCSWNLCPQQTNVSSSCWNLCCRSHSLLSLLNHARSRRSRTLSSCCPQQGRIQVVPSHRGRAAHSQHKAPPLWSSYQRPRAGSVGGQLHRHQGQHRQVLLLQLILCGTAGWWVSQTVLRRGREASH